MRDLPNLDLLRTLAVLSVIIEHTLLAYKIAVLGPFQIPWLGVVGVFFFFSFIPFLSFYGL